MTTPTTNLERMGYALIGISPLLSTEDIARITWQTEPGMLAIYLELMNGAVVNVNVGLEGSGASLANVVMTAFDLAQETLAETEGYWGQALPPCRAGHAHPATCAELDHAVALVCPADEQVVRILVHLP